MEAMAPIVDIQLSRLRAILAEKSISIDVSAPARNFLAEQGYNPAMGARPLQRVIQVRIQDPLAQFILEGTVTEGCKVSVDLVEGELVFDAEQAAPAADAPSAQGGSTTS
jgi:ATP-dependent Clp protease ATP-binding subunit ClpB